MNTQSDKVVVGLSGGVDSSVTALLLKQQGLNVEALFMKNWHKKNRDDGCLWEADAEDAMRVCEKLDIPLNTVDLSADYWERVFKSFVEEYRNGRTPNPDVLCNQEIKFKAFLEHTRQLGANRIATGHYARIDQRDGACRLLKGIDKNKDQSYFLCRLNQSQLGAALFPLGELEKTAVRKMAKQARLITHNKKDSTGICFIGKQPFQRFLSHYIPSEPGPVRTTDGKTIGEHDGVFYFTPGQRQGLEIGGVKGARDAPWYVVRKNIEQNELIVAQDHDHPLLHSYGLIASDIHWISGILPALPFQCSAKNRYRQPDQACVVEEADSGRWHIRFEKSQRALTSGQFIVFYHENICLGSGIIASVD